MSIKKLNKAGDTIVEVMVVLSILGLAIGISYATATRSLKSTRAAQENAEATAVLQSQLETLRYLAPSMSNPTTYGTFCIDPSPAGSPTPAPTTSDIKSGNGDIASHSGCTGFGSNGRYQIGITYDAADKSYELKATWDDIEESSSSSAIPDKASVTFDYRPYN